MKKKSSVEVLATESVQSSKIVKRERFYSKEELKEAAEAEAAKPEPKPAGIYRVIHGKVLIARAYEEWHNPDGSVRPNEASMETAYTGYEIYLSSADATLVWANGQLETLDAKPSRVGQGFIRPKTIPNQHAVIGGH